VPEGLVPPVAALQEEPVGESVPEEREARLDRVFRRRGEKPSCRRPGGAADVDDLRVRTRDERGPPADAESVSTFSVTRRDWKTALLAASFHSTRERCRPTGSAAVGGPTIETVTPIDALGASSACGGVTENPRVPARPPAIRGSSCRVRQRVEDGLGRKGPEAAPWVWKSVGGVSCEFVPDPRTDSLQSMTTSSWTAPIPWIFSSAVYVPRGEGSDHHVLEARPRSTCGEPGWITADDRSSFAKPGIEIARPDRRHRPGIAEDESRSSGSRRVRPSGPLATQSCGPS
jgi:hypothetical protein